MNNKTPFVYVFPETGEKNSGLEVYFSCNSIFNPELAKNIKFGK